MDSSSRAADAYLPGRTFTKLILPVVESMSSELPTLSTQPDQYIIPRLFQIGKGTPSILRNSPG
jgi:hypothetical protein